MRTAFSVASAPALVKNTCEKWSSTGPPRLATSLISRAASLRAALAWNGAIVHSVAACSWIAATSLGCWWPMLMLTSWLEKSR